MLSKKVLSITLLLSAAWSFIGLPIVSYQLCSQYFFSYIAAATILTLIIFSSVVIGNSLLHQMNNLAKKIVQKTTKLEPTKQSLQ